jgi:hypothetical protein
MEWNGDTAVVVGPDAHLQFDLPKPEFVSALSVREQDNRGEIRRS